MISLFSFVTGWKMNLMNATNHTWLASDLTNIQACFMRASDTQSWTQNSSKQGGLSCSIWGKKSILSQMAQI